MSTSGSDHVRVTAIDGSHWLELAQLRPPRAMGKPKRDAAGDFWGSIMLHTLDDHIRAYVGWNDAYTHMFSSFLSEVGAADAGWSGEKTHRTEDDDLIVSVLYDGSSPVSLRARVLDWWDPYHPSKGGYPHRRELSASFDVHYSDIQTFTRRTTRLLSTD